MFEFGIDRLSFWIGFLAGIIFVWIWRSLRPLLRDIQKNLRSQVSKVQVGFSSSIEQRYRQDVVRIAQDSHITAPLFSLDEIAIEPRLLAPPPQVIPGEELPPDDVFSVTIPYLPDWPIVGTTFNANTLSFSEVIGSGIDLALVGKPGAGKTFAINYIASQIARREVDFIQASDLIPVVVHAADLSLPEKKEKYLEVLYNALYEKVSTLVEAQLLSFLKTIFEKNLVILMVDGLDELTQAGSKPVLEYLLRLKEKYPGFRLILSTSIEYIPRVKGLNLTPIPLAAWNTTQTSEYISNWGRLWEEHVQSESWAKKLPKKLDPVLINGWLMNDLSSTNPLNLALKLWAVYAGDTIGPSPSESLEAYLRRMTINVANARTAIEQLAAQMVTSSEPMIARKEAGRFVAQYEDPSASSDRDTPKKESENAKTQGELSDDDFAELKNIELGEDDFEDLKDLESPVTSKKANKSEKKVSARRVRRMLPEMVKNSILIYRPGEKISFSHPVVGGYLAGCGLSNLGGSQELLSQPGWIGKNLSLQYLAAKGDVSAIVPTLLEGQKDDALRKGLLTVGQWPSAAPKTAPWRSTVMRSLASTINENGLSLGLRTRVVAALATSGDTGVGALFKQLLASQHPDVRHLAALGCGLIKDDSVINDLEGLLYDPLPNVRKAACLALVAIKTTKSIEMVAGALLNGEEDVRRAAAEALAEYPVEGHPILKEGSELDDLLVRRAVVYGLARIKEPWAIELLEHMQLEDSQWVVRTAAGQTLEDSIKPGQFLPKPLTTPYETPWLITFASEKGMGIAPGEASWDMLKKALKEGTEDQKLAAMEHYQQSPKAAVSAVPELYKILYGGDHEMREAAFNTLWQVSASGIELDSPVKFGLG